MRDQELIPEITRVHGENYNVYGAKKAWKQLNREGIEVGRDRVARLMRSLGLVGVRRGKFKRTTITDDTVDRPRTWSTASSQHPGPTGCGWRT